MKYGKLSVAMTYCGAVVGAGFATGREVVEFFTVYGQLGLFGVLIAALLFAWVGTAILSITHSNKVYSYSDLLRLILPRSGLATFTDGILAISLVSGAGVMIAAASSLAEKYPLTPSLVGGIFTLACILVLMRGSVGLLRANSFLVPGLVVGIVLLCMLEIYTAMASWLRPGPVPAALLYVAYNSAMAVVALTTLKGQLDSRSVKYGGIVGGSILGFLLLLVYLSSKGLTSAPMPLVALAQKWLGTGAWSYDFALMAAIFTTALASIHGLASRISAGQTMNYRQSLFAVASLGFLLSRFGFTGLVAVVYPLLGYCNIVLLLGLCYYKYKCWSGRCC